MLCIICIGDLYNQDVLDFLTMNEIEGKYDFSFMLWCIISDQSWKILW